MFHRKLRIGNNFYQLNLFLLCIHWSTNVSNQLQGCTELNEDQGGQKNCGRVMKGFFIPLIRGHIPVECNLLSVKCEHFACIKSGNILAPQLTPSTKSIPKIEYMSLCTDEIFSNLLGVLRHCRATRFVAHS